MVDNLYMEKQKIIPRRKRRINRRIKAKAKKRFTFCMSLCLCTISLTAFFVARNSYISAKSTNLSYAVEYYFTHGFSSKDKLLRVQKMTLIYSDGTFAVVEASGLSKEEPHKEVSIKGSFKKDNYKSWYLDSIQSPN